MRILDSAPLVELGTGQSDRAAHIACRVTRLPQQLHHEVDLIESSATLVDQSAQRPLLEPVHPVNFDVVTDVLIDEIDIALQGTRHLDDFGGRGRRLAGYARKA